MKKNYILGFPNLPLDFFPKSSSLPSVFLISKRSYIKLQTCWHFLLLPHSFYQAIVTLSSKQMQEFTTHLETRSVLTIHSVLLHYPSYQVILFSDLSLLVLYSSFRKERNLFQGQVIQHYSFAQCPSMTSHLRWILQYIPSPLLWP